MAIHKILIDDFICLNYELVAIHAALEDYRLAYLLNKTFGIQLQKSKYNLEIENKQGQSIFSHFLFEDERNGVIWNLIENKAFQHELLKKENGIFETIETVSYLLPEYKNAKFILKIENSETPFWSQKIIQQLTKKNTVSMVYEINSEKLKSKNNLIF